MFRQIKSSMLLGIAVCVLIGDNSPAVAVPVRDVFQGERYKNNTLEPALSMKKYLVDYNVVQDARHWPESDKFATCNWTRVFGDYSVIRCTGGVVPVGETAEIKFYVRALPETAAVLCAKWYSDATWTAFEGYATPVASPRGAAAVVRGVEYTVTIVQKNEAKQWVGEDPAPGALGDALGPVDGCEIYYAEWPRILHERDMTEDLWTCHQDGTNIPDPSQGACVDNASCDSGYTCGPNPGITWVHPGDWPATFSLPAAGDDTDPDFQLPGTYKGSEKILFRHYTDLVGVYGQSDYEVVQFRVRDLIPTVSEWGLVVIALLLAAGGTIVIMRRRAVAA